MVEPQNLEKGKLYEVETKDNSFVGYFVKQREGFFTKKPKILISMDKEDVEEEIEIKWEEIFKISELVRSE